MSIFLGLTEPTGNCTAAHYCTLAAIDPNPIAQPYGDYCYSGAYCPEGTATPIPCPAGTFLPNTSMDEELDCVPCTGGYYCETQGLSSVTGMYSL